MAHANLDELRFFLDGREQLADHVRAIGATITDLLRAVSLEECADGAPMSVRVHEVCALLEDARSDEITELSLDDIEFM